MTGGNALAAFIKMIQQWVIQLGVNVTQVIQTFKYVFFIFFPSCPFRTFIWDQVFWAAGNMFSLGNNKVVLSRRSGKLRLQLVLRRRMNLV